MARALAIEKWEGLGNDFIVVPAPLAADWLPTPSLVRALCDRRRGVGGDGVVIVTRAADGAPRMVVFNADGSRPELCGNGLRCVAASLVAASGRTGDDVVVRTDAGERRCRVRAERDRWWVEADMGHARLKGSLTVPETGGRHFVHVDVGNPHAVSFDPFVDADLDALGPALEHAVAGGINVALARVARATGPVAVIVWERGVGRTLACGTGACAVAAAAVAAGHVQADASIEMGLPGGVLTVSVRAADLGLRMGGPARRVLVGAAALPGLESVTEFESP
jgi:diaminopimelate epimerase